MKEQWKEIDGWPEYLISNYGQVFSKRRNRVLKLGKSNGYFQLTLCVNNVLVDVRVNRLVSFAFVDGYFEGAIVNHKNGIKTDNTYSNLEWITSRDNIRHAFAMGLAPRRFRIVETGDVFQRAASCAKHIGGNPDAILKCLNGTMKTHKGYTFEYVN